MSNLGLDVCRSSMITYVDRVDVVIELSVDYSVYSVASDWVTAIGTVAAKIAIAT